LDLSASGSTAASLNTVYGTAVADVDKDLGSYYRSTKLQGVLFKARFEKMETGKPRPATELETGLVLAKLLWFSGHKEEATRQLDRLAAGHKDSYEVEEALAYHAWQQGDIQSVLRHLELAVNRGATNWKTHWDYARLLANSGKDADRLLSAIRKTVELNPALVDAHILLGQELYRRRNYIQALIALREIKQLDPERASSTLGLMAYCALQASQREEARRYAETSRKYARGPQEIERAERLLRYLSRPDSPVAVNQPLAAAEEEDPASEQRPALLRRHEQEGAAAETPSRPAALTVTGRIVRFDCLGPVARIHVKAGPTTHALLLRSPDRVFIKNANGASVNMTCGEQSTPVTVEYDSAVDEKYATKGDVRTIEFLSK
jgi:tetratricopeptide (TPR) repeat protein